MTLVSAMIRPIPPKRRGRPVALDNPKHRDQVVSMIRLYRSGIPVRAIAAIARVSIPTAYEWLRKAPYLASLIDVPADQPPPN